jgi:hypothetical protein
MPFKNPTKSLKKYYTEADLINAESALGRTIFGPISTDYSREFFHHHDNVWIWHENGKTIRYEVRKNGVFKKTDGGDGKYHPITGIELENFCTAAKTYLQLVKSNIYS